MNIEGPIMIHIKTQKGKGYKFAEKSEDKYHGLSKFNISTGIQVALKTIKIENIIKLYVFESSLLNK